MTSSFFQDWLSSQPPIVRHFVRKDPNGNVAKAALRDARASFRKLKPTK